MPPEYSFGQHEDHVVYHDGMMKVRCYLIVFCLTRDVLHQIDS
jgi:hypothetical protein